MGNDIYRWEDGGGTVHHCAICQTPLTHANARSRCLGEHVECCPRYHTQLFKIGSSSECAPCKHTDAEHYKRHREIAELVHQLKGLREKHCLESQRHAPRQIIKSATPSPSSKKQRKAVRKAAKVAELPKVLTTSDIDFVEQTLHPHLYGHDEAEEEKKLLNDPEIKLNLYFHKGTSNTREVRHQLIVEMRGDKREPTVDDVEVDSLIKVLGVQMFSVKTAEEKRAVAALRCAIRKDLVEMAREEEATMERKGGFWRWASTKAYKRLVQNGRIWGQKDDVVTPRINRRDENATPPLLIPAPGKESYHGEATDPNSSEGEPNAVLGAQIDTPCYRRRASKADLSLKMRSPETPKVSEVYSEDDGWTQVVSTKSEKKASVTGTVKLSHNNGLAHFGRRTIAHSMGLLTVLSLQDIESEAESDGE